MISEKPERIGCNADNMQRSSPFWTTYSLRQKAVCCKQTVWDDADLPTAAQMLLWLLYSQQRTLMDVGKWGVIQLLHRDLLGTSSELWDHRTSTQQNLAKKIPNTWKGSPLPGNGELSCRLGTYRQAATERRQESRVWQEAETQGRFKQDNSQGNNLGKLALQQHPGQVEVRQDFKGQRNNFAGSMTWTE